MYGYVSAAHNWINFDTMSQVLNSGVTAKGNSRNNTCNGAYKGSLNAGAETKGEDYNEKNLPWHVNIRRISRGKPLSLLPCFKTK